MSARRTDYGGVTFDILSGITKELELTVIDPDTGNAKDLSDTNVYNSAIAIIYKPDGTQIGGNMTVYFDTPRTGGIVTFTVLSTHTNIRNAGNWIGLAKFYNIDGIEIDKQKFNLNIVESK